MTKFIDTNSIQFAAGVAVGTAIYFMFISKHIPASLGGSK